uniref:Protein kinase domain-containing protein n=1 Tax=Panagrolaimus sp. ES5 TaxID=591445 RepID=A0AC34FED1_9BILA
MSETNLQTSDSSTLLNTQALNLPNGTIIVTRSKKRFTIIDTLQKSINRAVYVSSLPNVEGKFVIKAEPPNCQGSGLKMEKAVAAAIQCATPMESERFSEFIDYGDSKIVNFIVWKRLGPSLDELHQMYRQKFSFATSTRINVQTLRAISKLHALGFIHRNIQPSHFVVGEAAKRVVYLISFSLCRSFKLSSKGLDSKRLPPSLQIAKKKSSSKRSTRLSPSSPSTAIFQDSDIPPKKNVDENNNAAMTSIAKESSPIQQYFAPRFWYSSDAGSTLSRLDDIESWLYLSLHFIDPESLPWSKTPLQMLTDIFEMKKHFFFHQYSADIFSILKLIPIEYRRFIDEINATQLNSTPDYEKMILIATKVSQSACPNPNSPYDWEEIPAPLLSDYGEFRVPAPSPATNPSNTGTFSIKKTKTLGTDDPEMDRLVENWQNNFRKLIISGVPRAQAYQRVMGISHPPELATGHWKAVKPKKKKKKSKSVEKIDTTQEQS